MFLSYFIVFLEITIWVALAVVFVLFSVLGVKALLKYLRSSDVRSESALLKKSMGEVLKAHRTRCKMTQEFVADQLGVSRQTVSKWETGVSDPSTSHLLRLAKLFGVSPAELLKEIDIEG